MGLTHISKSIVNIEKNLFEKFGYYKAMVYKNWYLSISKDMQSFCSLIRVGDNKDGTATVYISASSNIVALQLFYNKIPIMEKLNSIVGYKYVDDIKISSEK